MSRRRFPDLVVSAVVSTGILLAGFVSPVLAQGSDELFAGDSVRVAIPVLVMGDSEAVESRHLVGSVLKIEGREVTVIARGRSTCTAGLSHGEGPICNLGPLTYHTVVLGEASIQKRQVVGNRTTRTLLGGLAGAAALGAVGYAVGGRLGFDSDGGCRAGPGFSCDDSDRLPGETALEAKERRAAEQKASDQRRGALFFGVIGGTLGAMFGRKLSVGWIDISPSVPADPGEPWGLSLHLPAGAR